MAINEAIQSSCACYSAEITTPSRTLGRSQRWQDGTTWCLVSPATVLASWHENPCHQLLLGWSLCEQQMLLELNAKGLLHSQEQVLDVMVLRLVRLLLDTTVGWEQKCWKMKETVDVIKNVMSSEVWWTVDATLTGLRLICQHCSAFWWPCEVVCKGWLKTKTNVWAETGLSVRLEKYTDNHATTSDWHCYTWEQNPLAHGLYQRSQRRE